MRPDDDIINERCISLLGVASNDRDDLTAALDEAERLRAELAGERAAVVAWLRGQADLHRESGRLTGAFQFGMLAAEAGRLADAIERGDHRPGGVTR